MPTRKETVMNVSEIPGGGNHVLAVLKAYKAYQTEINQDELSRYGGNLPDAQVFYNKLTQGVIIILAERHDSADAKVQKLAKAVAEKVLAIPKVKIAVEEPIEYNGRLLSNVGWGKNVTTKSKDTALFDFEATGQGSLSHQIYVKQVEGAMSDIIRYAAEKMPRDPQRYNNPNINRTMAQKLNANTGRMGEISVFPVGPDHVHNTDYDSTTLDKHLMMAGWYLLANR
jgi:hypothetical protein